MRISDWSSDVCSSDLTPPLAALAGFLDEFPGRVLFTAESAGRREVLLELLERLKLRPKTVDSWPDFVAGKDRLAITIAPLNDGLVLEDPALALVAESPLFGQRVMQRRRREKRADAANDAEIGRASCRDRVCQYV